MARDCERSDQVDDLLRDVGDRDGFRRQRQPAGFNPCDVQHLVDQRKQMSAASEDLPSRFQLLRVRRVHLEQLREAQDGIERRPEIVAHSRKEFTLRATCPLRFQLREPGLLFRRLSVRDVFRNAEEVACDAT